MLRFAKRSLDSIVSWGIDDETTVLEATQVRFTNIMLLGLLVASLGQTSILFWSGAWEAALINSTAPFVFGSGLLLMKFGYTRTARLLVLTIAYSAGYVIATILGAGAHFQLILLFGSALSLSFFSLDEWGCLLYGLMLPIGCVIGLELTDFAPVLGVQRAQFSAHQLMVLRLSTTTVVWLLVIGLFISHVRARRRTQEQLISSAKLVALGQMAAGIAHEVNHPLAEIASDLQLVGELAARRDPPMEEFAQVAQRSYDTARNVSTIVRGLLTLSRDASQEPLAPVSVRKLVALTLAYCRSRMESNGVELRLSEIGASWKVIGRQVQLSEVLLNLLNNALYAVTELEERWIEIAVWVGMTHVEISVTDSGHGIAPDVQRRMFDPFFTSKPAGKGTGLGLSVSRAIVAAHKGELEYDSTSERTRFVIRLPRGE